MVGIIIALAAWRPVILCSAVWLLFTLTAAASDSAVSLSGTVVDAQGDAVPGAMVVVAEGPPALRFIKRLARSATPKAPDVLNSAAADASGKFTLPLPDEAPEVGWRRWRLTVWAYHPSLGLSVRLIDRDWPRAGLPLPLALARGVRARLKITDSQGRPVAGARVRPQRVAGQQAPAMLAERLAAATDADGFAIVAGAAADDLEVVAVESETGGAQWAAVPRLGADNSTTIALAPVGRLVGRLTADDPRAARRRKLRFATWQALDDDRDGGGLANVTTDDDGRFEVSAIAAGSLSFEVDDGDEPGGRPGRRGAIRRGNLRNNWRRSPRCLPVTTVPPRVRCSNRFPRACEKRLPRPTRTRG